MTNIRKSNKQHGLAFLEDLRDHLKEAAQRIKATQLATKAPFASATGQGMTYQQKTQMLITMGFNKCKKIIKCQCYTKGDKCKLHGT